MSENNQNQETTKLCLLPLRDVVVFPNMVVPLFVGRSKSIKALEKSMELNQKILLVTQKDPSDDDPKPSNLFKVGTLSSILQLLKLPDGTVKVLAEGVSRVNIKKYFDNDEYLQATYSKFKEESDIKDKPEALRRTILSHFEQYVKLNKKISSEVFVSVSSIESVDRLVDTISSQISIKIEDKQNILESNSLENRISLLLKLLGSELEILQLEKKIRGRVKRQMEKSQREYYLNEQAKAIQKELGESDDQSEIDEYESKINKVKLSKEARVKAIAELKKLKSMSPMSAESTVVRNYLDVLLGLPWGHNKKVTIDLEASRNILDSDHAGLEKVKERIIEHLAVQSRVKKSKSPILLLVGPPGVGKTSLGQSIAKSTNRKFVRMALGGVRDEAEIRGHRRTYIGSMPGKILQNLSKSGVNNPLFLFDEVDKIGMDYRGDPASALLEVLDPEQNSKFGDHYLEVDYDLSNIMFIATANTLNIPSALLDRMEVIRLPGYTENEKLQIAKNHLLEKQIKLNGLKSNQIQISDSAIIDTIRKYTREAGVRNLEKEISKICRKVLTDIILNAKNKISVSSKNLKVYLGVEKFKYGLANNKNLIGQVTGLAWTEFGGELLTIESISYNGKGNIIRTGSLGDVMKESVEAARSLVKSRSDKFHIDNEVFEKTDLHIHFPEGATPKDGPSAGIGITLSILSSLTKIPVKCNVAMTGEITLRGEVLPIGGLKEKLLAAIRGGIKQVLIPKDNIKDLAELPKKVINSIEIIPVQLIDEVFEHGLEWMPDESNRNKEDSNLKVHQKMVDEKSSGAFKH
jgi:ATP-dependent Lon protease